MTISLQEIPWARRLKLRHLEMFLALHDAGSLTEAGNRLFMTQPAMSHWLAETEDVVGAPLFIRKGKLRLTAAGEVFLRHAERMITDVKRTNEELAALHAGLTGRLHVGTIQAAAPVLLPRAIARLQQLNPGIFASVVESGLTDLLERLDKRELDVVIGALDVRAHRSGFATESLAVDSVQVVARPTHPLVRQRRPKWSDTDQYPWIMPPAWSLLRSKLEESFAAQHVRSPAPSVEATSNMAVQMLMRDIDYLAVMPESVAQLYSSLGVIARVKLKPTMDSPDVGVIWAPDRTNALVTKFIDVLRGEAKGL